MKKPYSKPQIAVETVRLDHPVAGGCIADFEDVNALVGMGYFGDDMGCTTEWIDNGNHDTICYHSNIQTAFSS